MQEPQAKHIAIAQYDVLSESLEMWQHHVFWCFLCLQSRVFQSPNAQTVEQELMSCGERYGAFMEQFYGREVGGQVKENMRCFTGHYVYYLDSLTDKDASASRIHREWVECGDRMAEKLASLNPYWREMEWRAMITQEITILESQAKKNLEGAYEKLGPDFRVYDSIAREMSDYMSAGVIRQFDIH